MLHGSCLCGDVTFTIDGACTMMGHCHCSMCRKAHGAVCSTYVAAPRGTLRIAGGDATQRYASTPDVERAFCRRCGATVPSGQPAGDLDFALAGLLDDDPGIRPTHHLFAGSKAPWHTISDDLKQFDAYPPGMGEAVEHHRNTDAAAGKVRGSCLCGGVAYEVDGELEGPIVHCHCRRCRKARAAAHASNCIVPVERFRWLRGEAQVATYKVPEAERFAVAFCSVCGGGVPRVSPQSGRIVIPAASFDDDPGARPELHIFVASKASWHEITDDLPQHDEAAPGPFPPVSRRARGTSSTSA